jgi:hypothetical protein
MQETVRAEVKGDKRLWDWWSWSLCRSIDELENGDVSRETDAELLLRDGNYVKTVRTKEWAMDVRCERRLERERQACLG